MTNSDRETSVDFILQIIATASDALALALAMALRSKVLALALKPWPCH